jgi:hypothetical protein
MIRTVNKNPSVDELKTFGWVMLGGFALLGTLLWYSSLKPQGAWWPAGGWGWTGAFRQEVAVAFWALGALVWAISIVSTALTRRVYVVWMTGGYYVGTVTSFLLLSVLYFAVLPVFSLIRLTDPLRLRLSSSGTYWEKPTEHEATLERMSRPF